MGLEYAIGKELDSQFYQHALARGTCRQFVLIPFSLHEIQGLCKLVKQHCRKIAIATMQQAGDLAKRPPCQAVGCVVSCGIAYCGGSLDVQRFLPLVFQYGRHNFADKFGALAALNVGRYGLDLVPGQIFKPLRQGQVLFQRGISTVWLVG